MKDARRNGYVGASFYGDNGGAYHSNLWDGGNYFARLQTGGKWWNRFQPGSHWTAIYGHKTVRTTVGDWGSGGGPLMGAERGVDMHASMMDDLGLHDNAALLMTQHRCV